MVPRPTIGTFSNIPGIVRKSPSTTLLLDTTGIIVDPRLTEVLSAEALTWEYTVANPTVVIPVIKTLFKLPDTLM